MTCVEQLCPTTNTHTLTPHLAFQYCSQYFVGPLLRHPLVFILDFKTSPLGAFSLPLLSFLSGPQGGLQALQLSQHSLILQHRLCFWPCLPILPQPTHFSASSLYRSSSCSYPRLVPKTVGEINLYKPCKREHHRQTHYRSHNISQWQ